MNANCQGNCHCVLKTESNRRKQRKSTVSTSNTSDEPCHKTNRTDASSASPGVTSAGKFFGNLVLPGLVVSSSDNASPYTAIETKSSIGESSSGSLRRRSDTLAVYRAAVEPGEEHGCGDLTLSDRKASAAPLGGNGEEVPLAVKGEEMPLEGEAG